jgi:hypothetical protein
MEETRKVVSGVDGGREGEKCDECRNRNDAFAFSW